MTDPATIERLANEAGYIVGEYGIAHLQYGLEDETELLTRFAALVEAHERERCAKTCDDRAAELLAPKRVAQVDRHTAYVIEACAAAIRAL